MVLDGGRRRFAVDPGDAALRLLDPILIGYTHMGDVGLLWIALSLLLLAFRPTRKAGMLGLLALLIGMLCTNVVLKHLVGPGAGPGTRWRGWSR